MMIMKFSLISDMHVDFPQPKTPYDKFEDFVIVAGDTSNGLAGTKFLNKIKNKGFDLFAIDGNHEHYKNQAQGRTHAQTHANFYELIKQPCFVRLTDDLYIVGTNGWYLVSDESLWQGYMNDGIYSTLTAAEVNQLAVEDSVYLDTILGTEPGRAIVVTHTAPCLDTLSPQYEGHYSNEWYWNPYNFDVLDRYRDKIAVWCHGHSHAPADKIIKGVRVVCNPRGYPNENPDWAPMTIEI